MTKNDKIHIKLEICKDETSNELKIMTHFDSAAPNFFKDKDSYLWMPTVEEKDFINEAFELMSIDKIISPPEKTPQEPPETKETTEPPAEKEEEKPKIIPSPFGKKREKKPVELPPVEKTEDETVFEMTGEETKSEDVDTKIKKEENKEVFVKTNENTIEEALKKRDEEYKSIVEADEKTIIEKVLSQKKKGRWSKEH